MAFVGNRWWETEEESEAAHRYAASVANEKYREMIAQGADPETARLAAELVHVDEYIWALHGLFEEDKELLMGRPNGLTESLRNNLRNEMYNATSAVLAELDQFIVPLREIRDTVIAMSALPLDPARRRLVAQAFERFAASMREGGQHEAFAGALATLRQFHDQLKEHCGG